MKRNILNKLFFVLFAATIALTGCKEDDETPAPTIRIASTDPATVAGVINTLAGEEVTITLQTNAQEGIKRLNGTQTIGTQETQLSGYPVTSFTGDRKSDTRIIDYDVPATLTGDLILRFEVTDDKDKVAAVTVTIRVTSNINTYSAVLLNNQFDGNSPNAFYDPINNMRYTIAQAKANSSNVHIVHAFRNSAEGSRKLVAPNSTDAFAVYDGASSPDRIGTWSSRNATKFKMLALTETQFNAVNDVASLQGAAGAADTYTTDNVGNLVTGSTFGAVLSTGKFVIGRVTATTGPDAFVQGANNAGSVTLTFKSER